MSKIKLKQKKLNKKQDERGWLAELIRGEDVYGEPFGQLLITVAKPGFTKGNHYHLRKKEWYCVIEGKGVLNVWNKEKTEKLKIELSSDNLTLVEMPQAYFHSITNTGDSDLILLAYLNEPFNPKDQDTYYE